MNNLFKLKKDGKVVGYLQFDKYRPTYNNDLEVYGKWIDDPNEEWREGVTPEFDEILPFVCDDKNGDEVFAGDTVKMQNPSTLEWNIEGVITQNEKILAFYIKSGCCRWSMDNNIELIKEAE